jgi:hypothetical protein
MNHLVDHTQHDEYSVVSSVNGITEHRKSLFRETMSISKSIDTWQNMSPDNLWLIQKKYLFLLPLHTNLGLMKKPLLESWIEIEVGFQLDVRIFEKSKFKINEWICGPPH